MAAKAYCEASLKAHNELRALHGAQSLVLKKELCATAQRWADDIAKRNAFGHSKPADRMHNGKQMGENIAMKWTSSGDPYEAHEAVDQWYDEIERFDFKSASGPRTGHFTQVVWAESREYGVGKAQTADGKWFVVANYSPAGNLGGAYAANVKPPSGDKPKRKAAASSSAVAKPTGTSASSDAMTSRQTYGSSVSRSTRTETTRGPDGKTVTKTIVTETTTDAAGNKQTTTKEITSDGGAGAVERKF